MVVLRRSTVNRTTRDSSRSRSKSTSPQSQSGHQPTTNHDLDKPGKHRGRPPVHSPPFPPPRVSPTSSKRARSSTSALADRQNGQKRRKVETRSQLPRLPSLHIPLRSRGGVTTKTANLSPNVRQPQATTLPNIATSPGPRNNRPYFIKHDSVEPPTPRAEYDRIKQIEAKARAAIQDVGKSQTAKQDDRRKLRSEHGASRSKTELAQYFPNFEEMLSLEPPDPETITATTKLILINDTPDYRPPSSQSDPFKAPKDVPGVGLIDLVPSSRFTPNSPDPLNAEVYLKVHRKAERHEKQMKNGDRERAQHEKYQLERLLDDLRGPDWLKTLGISGVTDTEKKRYEPKRALFIRETNALINKFKWWKEEERRRKLEREQQMMEEIAEQADVENARVDQADDDEADDDEDDDDNDDSSEEDSSSSSEEESRSHLTTNPASPSDLDALASQQLLEEAKSARRRRRKKIGLTQLPVPPPYVAFISFFAKRHLRDAAVHGRHRGRTLLAFGQPLPDMAEGEFELPDSILTEEAIRDNQRSRRRRRRDVDSDG